MSSEQIYCIVIADRPYGPAAPAEYELKCPVERLLSLTLHDDPSTSGPTSLLTSYSIDTLLEDSDYCGLEIRLAIFPSAHAER